MFKSTQNVLGVFAAISTTVTITTSVDILAQLTKERAEQLVVTTVPLLDEINTKGVEVKNVLGRSILETGVAQELWGKWFPGALERGDYVPKPDAEVVVSEIQTIFLRFWMARSHLNLPRMVSADHFLHSCIVTQPDIA